MLLVAVVVVVKLINYYISLRPSLNAVYNVTERLKVDLGIHYIFHKLTKLELSQMSGNNNNNSNSNSRNTNDEMKKDEAFSNQVKYFVIKVHTEIFVFYVL